MTKRKKKEPTFRKIENGMILFSDYGILVGLPTEVETLTSAEGKVLLPIAGGAKGKTYSKVKYDWRVISGSPLPSAAMSDLQKSIANTSGTVVASFSNAIAPSIIYCKKCGIPNLEVGKFCSNCGNPL